MLPLSIGVTATLLGAVSFTGDATQVRFARVALGVLLALTAFARLAGLVG